MKRFVYVGLLLCAASIALYAQDAPESTDVPVAFGITLADLHRAAESGDDRAVPDDKALALDAEIGSITVRNETDERFTAEIELIGGAWHGEEEVELFRAYVVFDGLRYRDAFSRKSTERLQTGDRILVLGRYLGIGMDYDEKTPVAVVEGIDFRRLD